MKVDKTIAELQSAHGDPWKLALITLNLILESHEPWLRPAIEAAAIPHWFTPTLLAALLNIDESTASTYALQLQHLPIVEPSKARAAWSVKETYRLALWSQLANDQSDRFRQLSASAAALFEGHEAHQKIERLYHQLVVTPDAASTELKKLYQPWGQASRSEPLPSLGVSLGELLHGIPLAPVAQALVLLYYGLASRDASEGGSEEVVRQSLALFQSQLKDRRSEACAHDLLGDILAKNSRRAEAMSEYESCRQILKQLIAQDSDDAALQRDLAITHSKLGSLLVWDDRHKEALEEYQAYRHVMLDQLDAKSVFVVYGRNVRARDALFTFLSSLGLTPLDWTALVEATDDPMPHINQILRAGFKIANRAVVLMTPDDEARLRQHFLKPDDLEYEGI